MPAKNTSKEMIGMENYNINGSLYRIKEYYNYHNIIVEFPDSNYVCNSNMNYFKKGRIKCPYDKNIYGGYLGEGEYKSSHKAYKTWFNMLTRTQDDLYKNNKPTYKDCTVCEEWLNFQNFAQWYDENYYEVPGQHMHLDKDILIKNNKIYSPETCCFIPATINSVFTNRRTQRKECLGVKRIGEKYQAKCSNRTETYQYLGQYDSLEEAFFAYKNFKEQYIKQIADEYIEYLPFHVYEAMYNYEIDIDD